MDTILVATDGSLQSRAAVTAAVQKAHAGRARLVCVHVVSVLDFAPEQNGRTRIPPSRLPRAEDDAALSEALELASANGVEAVAELLVGYPAHQIIRLADEIGADLIVVGSRGLGPVKSAVVGSTSREVLAHAGRPVLAVPDVPSAESAPT